MPNSVKDQTINTSSSNTSTISKCIISIISRHPKPTTNLQTLYQNYMQKLSKLMYLYNTSNSKRYYFLLTTLKTILKTILLNFNLPNQGNFNICFPDIKNLFNHSCTILHIMIYVTLISIFLISYAYISLKNMRAINSKTCIPWQYFLLYSSVLIAIYLNSRVKRSWSSWMSYCSLEKTTS